MLIIGSVLIVRQQHVTPYQHNVGTIFGTIYHFTYQSNDDLQKELEAELKKVDQTLSPFNQTSIISRINRNEPVKLNDMFCNVFKLAMSVSKETNGAFDITVAPMVNAWGFGFKTGTPPTKHVIDSLKSIVGYKKINMENGTIIKQTPQAMLDCSAIAKGYGADIAARLLRKKGISNFMIEIGGEVVTSGNSDKRMPWRIGVNKPIDDSLSTNQELQTVLNITDVALATSGNYRNFYYKNGRKYAHTIDPKTGYPVQHNILSATVLAPDCATADAYATAFMVMGLEGSKQILAKHPELMAYLIYSDKKGNNAIWFSPSLEEKIQK